MSPRGGVWHRPPGVSARPPATPPEEQHTLERIPRFAKSRRPEPPVPLPRRATTSEDEGRFKRFGANLEELSFSSETYGDLFQGRAENAVAAIYYDIDGNGQGDTYLVFARILGPGE